jgi:hypothetical protein
MQDTEETVMTKYSTEKDRLTTIVRRVARVWSIPSIAALLLPSIVEGPYWLQANSLREVIGHLCWFGMFLGLILAWRWEGLGGNITVAGFAAFYLTWWLSGRFPSGPFFALIAAPGFLFLVCWLRTRHEQKSDAMAQAVQGR